MCFESFRTNALNSWNESRNLSNVGELNSNAMKAQNPNSYIYPLQLKLFAYAYKNHKTIQYIVTKFQHNFCTLASTHKK
jgi:hypothetical protein